MRTITAGDIMNREVFTFPDDAPVRDLATFLMDKQISGVAVVDRAGKLVGVVSVTDIANETADLGEASGGPPAFFMPGEERRFNPEDLQGLHLENEGHLVRDIMTPIVYTIPDDTPVPAVAKTMIAGHIHRLLVTRSGQVVGIVTSLGLLQLLADDRFCRVEERRELHISIRE